MPDVFGFSLDETWTYENGFYLTSHVSRLGKLLAHYELYKSIINLPGHVVECGVYKGASLVRFATFREILESPYSRKIIGFDAFGTFPRQGDAEDLAFIDRFQREGGDGIPRESLQQVLAHKALSNVELIAGDICETIPAWLAAHPAAKIALLHVDVDVYHPSKVILDTLVDRVVSGGLVVLDDFGTVAGETRAVDEFVTGTGLRLEKLPLSHIPAFIRKP